MVVTPVVPSSLSPAHCTVSPGVTTATTTFPVTVESTSVAPSTVSAPSQTRANEPASSPPAITVTGASATPGINTSTTSSPATPTATVNVTKATVIAAPVPTLSLPTVVTAPAITCPVITTSPSTVVLTTAVATSVVTTPASSVSSVPIILSGVKSAPSLAPKRGKVCLLQHIVANALFFLSSLIVGTQYAIAEPNLSIDSLVSPLFPEWDKKCNLSSGLFYSSLA